MADFFSRILQFHPCLEDETLAISDLDDEQLAKCEFDALGNYVQTFRQLLLANQFAQLVQEYKRLNEEDIQVEPRLLSLSTSSKHRPMGPVSQELPLLEIQISRSTRYVSQFQTFDICVLRLNLEHHPEMSKPQAQKCMHECLVCVEFVDGDTLLVRLSGQPKDSPIDHHQIASWISMLNGASSSLIQHILNAFSQMPCSHAAPSQNRITSHHWTLRRLDSLVTAVRQWNALKRMNLVAPQLLIPLLKPSLLRRKHDSDLSPIDFLPSAFVQRLQSRLNHSQFQALRSILQTVSSQDAMSIQLVIGPPGTGKSSTAISSLNACHLRQFLRMYDDRKAFWVSNWIERFQSSTFRHQHESTANLRNLIDLFLTKLLFHPRWTTTSRLDIASERHSHVASHLSLLHQSLLVCSVGCIEQLHSTLSHAGRLHPRLLVTAPSNAAVDELMSRVMAREFVDGTLNSYSPYVIRIAGKERCRADLEHLTAESLASKWMNLSPLQCVQRMQTLCTDFRMLFVDLAETERQVFAQLNVMHQSSFLATGRPTDPTAFESFLSTQCMSSISHRLQQEERAARLIKDFERLIMFLQSNRAMFQASGKSCAPTMPSVQSQRRALEQAVVLSLLEQSELVFSTLSSLYSADMRSQVTPLAALLLRQYKFIESNPITESHHIQWIKLQPAQVTAALVNLIDSLDVEEKSEVINNSNESDHSKVASLGDSAAHSTSPDRMSTSLSTSSTSLPSLGSAQEDLRSTETRQLTQWLTSTAEDGEITEIPSLQILSDASQAVEHRTDWDLVLVDEAAQATELDVLLAMTSMSRSSALCLIGDPSQLPATVLLRRSEWRLALQRSLFARFISAKAPSHLLNIQYRMHPSIRRWPSQQFYAGQLQDGPNIIRVVASENQRSQRANSSAMKGMGELQVEYQKQWHQHSMFAPLAVIDTSELQRSAMTHTSESLANAFEANLIVHHLHAYYRYAQHFQWTEFVHALSLRCNFFSHFCEIKKCRDTAEDSRAFLLPRTSGAAAEVIQSS